jgi:hypothetical protein
MVERDKFRRAKLIKALDKISDQLPRSIEAFLIGGLSMIFHGAKVATKDVDLVFLDSESAQAFINAAYKVGFNDVENLRGGYKDMEARIILSEKDGVQFDVFVIKVCNALTFSAGMKSRAQKKYDNNNLKLFITSTEDIFVFKAITSRPDDLADMATLAGAELKWDIIKEEVRRQPEHWKWLSRLYLRLEELEETYGIPSPLKTELREEAEIAGAIGILITKFKGDPFSFDNAQKALEEDDSEFVKNVIKEMIMLGIIEEKNEMYHFQMGIIEPL